MKPVNYITNKVHSSEDGLTHCWRLPWNPELQKYEYIIQTENPDVAKKLKGLEEVAYGVNHFMQQFIAAQEQIDPILKKAGLPPRKASEGRVVHGKNLGTKYKSVLVEK